MKILLKYAIKHHISPAAWEWIRSIARKNIFLGIFFSVFVRKYRTKGLVFEIPFDLFPIDSRASLLFDIYEGAERSLCERHILDSDRVIELGGGVGVISCTINQLLSDRKAHVVVEPHPEAFSCLHRNQNRNHAQFLIVNSIITPNSIEEISFGDALSEVTGGKFSCRIPGTTLDELDRKYGPFSVLVMDIEGAELFVAMNSASVISGYRMIILELHPSIIGEEQCEKVREIFRSLGFTRSGEKSCVEAWRRNTITS